MTTDGFKREDIYTPAEHSAFHKGFEDAQSTLMNGEPVERDTSSFSPAEFEAYTAGQEAGKPRFNGTAYLIASH